MAATVWKSERLVYRGVEPEDDPVLYKISNNPESFMNSAPFLPTPRTQKSAVEFREWLSSCTMAAAMCLPAPQSSDDAADKKSDKTSDKTADKPSDKPVAIGFISLEKPGMPQLQFLRRTEISLTILPEYQGQGYGTEALNWVLRWAFQHANMHRVGIGVFDHNVGALRLYKRIGFIQEAKRRDFLWHNGRYCDLIELAILEDEWRAKQKDIDAQAKKGAENSI